MEKALILCQPCWAMCKTLLRYQHCFSHKSNARCRAGCCEENWLHPSQTVHPRARGEALELKFRFEPLTRSDRWVTSLLLNAPFAVSVLWGLGQCYVHWSSYLHLVWVRGSHWSPSETAAVDRHTFYFGILVTCMTGICYLPDNGFAYWNTLGLIFMLIPSLLVQLKQILLRWPIKYMFIRCVTFPEILKSWI